MAEKTVLIIGAGIAGLSAGIYAQLNGYKSRIFEMHTQPGGLMTSWKRKGYVIDGCIHWLTGSSKDFPQFYQMWEDIGLIQGRQIFDPEVFMRFEGKDGQVLSLYTDVDRLEQHLLELSPTDEKTIREFTGAIRKLSGNMPEMPEGGLQKVLGTVKMLPTMPIFIKWGGMTLQQFADKFSSPFLRRAFTEMWFPEMSAIGLPVTLAMLNKKGAGYTIGGSLPMAHAVESRYCALGGEIRYGARVAKILTEPAAAGMGSRVAGIQLEDGSVERADVVISAADAHATLYNMLGDRFTTPEFKTMFETTKIFPPILYVGLGVNRVFNDLPQCTGGLEIELNEPVEAAGESITRLSTMVYNFDPTLAPHGKTAITLMAPTSYQYWKDLYDESPEHERYETEKQRVALQIIDRLDQRFPGLEGQVEMADVATPVTFERYTGNWQGSFEGWIPTTKNMNKPISKTLPGLANFYMVGQWVQAGGGLPSGVMTGREVLRMICKQDGKKFTNKG